MAIDWNKLQFPLSKAAILLGRIKRKSRPVEAIVEEALAHLKRYAAA